MRPPTKDDAAGQARRRDNKGNGQGRRNDSTPAFVVIAITRHGRRIVAGRFDSLEIAQRNARILRKLARLTGGDAVVEHAVRR